MPIASVQLNTATATILSRLATEYGGLTLKNPQPSDPLARIGQPAQQRAPQGHAPRAPEARSSESRGGRPSASARPANPNEAPKTLADIQRSLSDLRSALTRSAASAKRDVPAPKQQAAERYIDRDIFATVDRYESRDVLGDRDVFETRDVFEAQNVYETRAVYGQQAILETHVAGTRDLSHFSSTLAIVGAGIDLGADFSVAVGNAAPAIVKFASLGDISVTKNNSTTHFHFNPLDGSFRSGLVQALNSIGGLTASFAANGKLDLKTAGAQSLAIADVANGLLDLSHSPLAALGLTAGTTQASVAGYQTVQTGTAQVVVGTTQVKIGTQQVKIGIERVRVGAEQFLAGVKSVKIATERVVERAPVADKPVVATTLKANDLTIRAASQLISQIGASEFESAGRLLGGQGTPAEKALKTLRALNFNSLTDVSSADAIAASLARIDTALKAVDRLKASLASKTAQAAAANPLDLLSASAFGAANYANAGSSLRASGSYRGAPQSPGLAASNAVGGGPIKLRSLV